MTATIASLYNRHAGSACFILGNGPSLSHLRLTALRGHYFFGVNRGYLAYQSGLPTIPYYVFSDPLSYGPYAAEIRQARVGQRFYRSDVYRMPEYALAPDREAALELTYHVSPCMDDGHFATRLEQGLYRGFSVVMDALQLAYHMGFGEVYLLGCDFSYAGPQTHFYGSGALEQSRRHDMPIERVFKAFETARRVFERDGRRLVNATPGSALQVLPAQDFEAVVDGLPRPCPGVLTAPRH